MNIKTYPYKLKFKWLENSPEYYDTLKSECISSLIFLLRKNGVILGKKCFAQTTYNKLSFTKECYSFLKNFFKTKIIFQNQILILTDIWSYGPYHFYVDVMSKIVQLIYSKNIALSSCKILLYDDVFTHNVIIPIFRNVGLLNNEIILLNKANQYILIGKGFFITKPHVVGSNNPNCIAKVYDLLNLSIDKFNNSHGSTPEFKGIYYYRPNNRRKVVNDTFILLKLAKLGFYCTSFQDLSYLDSFRIMKRTKLFIGIHGGGLTNMIFMPRYSRIIEIKNNNNNPKLHCYWHLARSLNFDYTMFIAETVGNSIIVEGSEGCDLYVDWKILKELILKKD